MYVQVICNGSVLPFGIRIPLITCTCMTKKGPDYRVRLNMLLEITIYDILWPYPWIQVCRANNEEQKKKINGVETTCCIFERHAHYKGPKVRPLGLIN